MSAEIHRQIDAERPVLIAGPTASGKSSLALDISNTSGGVIINADALQVFANWRILTARPSDADEQAVPHRLYGHVAGHTPYSVGHWLRDVAPLLDGQRPIIVGGTGLYFSALTEGLADIPETPAHIRKAANDMRPQDMLAQIGEETARRIDTANPMRVQRAWEVLQTTGRALSDWQDATPPALLALDTCQAFVFEAPKDWLTPRIERRFQMMLDAGVLEEADRNLDTWNASHPSAKAIGARELIAHIQGEMSLEDAKEAICVATRQYAKRQRTWFKSRMKNWQRITQR